MGEWRLSYTLFSREVFLSSFAQLADYRPLQGGWAVVNAVTVGTLTMIVYRKPQKSFQPFLYHLPLSVLRKALFESKGGSHARLLFLESLREPVRRRETIHGSICLPRRQPFSCGRGQPQALMFKTPSQFFTVYRRAETPYQGSTENPWSVSGSVRHTFHGLASVIPHHIKRQAMFLVQFLNKINNELPSLDFDVNTFLVYIPLLAEVLESCLNLSWLRVCLEYASNETMTSLCQQHE